DEALKALDDMLSESAEGEDATKILLAHKIILETARAESIDAAYAKLLRPSPLTLALQHLPDDLRAAIQAMIAVRSVAELLEQTRQHPVLLTEETTKAIDKLLDELRQAGQEAEVKHIEARYEILKQ